MLVGSRCTVQNDSPKTDFLQYLKSKVNMETRELLTTLSESMYYLSCLSVYINVCTELTQSIMKVKGEWESKWKWTVSLSFNRECFYNLVFETHHRNICKCYQTKQCIHTIYIHVYKPFVIFWVLHPRLYIQSLLLSSLYPQ